MKWYFEPKVDGLQSKWFSQSESSLRGKLDSRFAWLVGAALSRLVALFPFTVADTASNRSRKSFVFWQCAVGGAPGYRLVSEFQLPVGDWPRPSNGAVSRQCRVSPTYSTYTPSLPRTPLLATLRSFLALIVTHCLLRLEMWHTTEAICWSTALTTGILFDAPRASWLFGGQAVETTLLPWQWICLRSYACWSSHPLRWKVNKKLGLILAVYVDMTLSEGRFVMWGMHARFCVRQRCVRGMQSDAMHVGRCGHPVISEQHPPAPLV